jgi:opacity protein-like surface antigen
MSRSFLCTCVVVVASIFAPSLALAQDYPRAEIFGGYSYLHIDTQGISSNSLINECNILAGGTCPLTFGVHPGFNGWTASGQYNLSRWLGVEANVSGTYGNIVTAKIAIPLPIPPLNLSIPDQHIYDFLFGPVISRRAHSYTVFAHGLIGGEHVGSGNFALAPVPIAVPPPSFSETDFAFALSGGLDIRITRHFSVRAGQFDYQFVSSSGNGHQNDFRFQAELSSVSEGNKV